MAEILNCEAVRQAIPAYLAGELAPETHYAVDRHLGDCEPCSAYANEERELNHVLRAAVTVDADAAQRLERCIRTRLDEADIIPNIAKVQHNPRWPFWRLRWAISSAAAAALLIAALYLGPIIADRPSHLLCRDAVEDHQEEVMDNAPRKWRTADADVQGLLARLGERALPKSAGNLTFERARICTLGGRNFIHAVYISGQTEYSVFVAPVEKADAAQAMPFTLVRAERIANTAVAEYHSNAHTLLVAGDAPVSRLLELSAQLASTL